MEGEEAVSKETDSLKYQIEIQSMMFTAGDVRHPNSDSSQMVEEIVRMELISLLRQSGQITAKRGSRFMSIEDVIFCIRHDSCKVSRLLDFLSWKDLRKNVSKSSAAGDGGVSVNSGSQAIPEDEDILDEQEKPKVPKRRRIKLNFDPLTQYYDYLDGHQNDENDNDADDEDIADGLITSEVLRKLKQADDLTRSMSKEEYVEYAEARQASFTYKKAKKFREWLNVHHLMDFKPSDDVLEILGYIAWEMVFKLTEAALCSKDDMQRDILIRNFHAKKIELEKEVVKHRQASLISRAKQTECSEKEIQMQLSLDKLKSTFPLDIYLKDGGELPLFVESECMSESLELDAAVTPASEDSSKTSTDADGSRRRRMSVYPPQDTIDMNALVPSSALLPVHIYEACRRLQLICPQLKQFKFAPVQSRHATLYSTASGL